MQGQFCYAEVVVEPLPGAMNRVGVATRKGLEGMVSTEQCLSSSTWLPVLARQRALQANVQLNILLNSSYSHLTPPSPPPSPPSPPS